jgi:STE24 endopeptidase
MTSTTLFYIIISIIIINFIIEKILDFLNAQQYNDALPKEVSDVYNQEEYLKSQAYKKVNFKLSTITSLFSLITTLLFFILNGFEFVDQIARTLCTNNIIIALLFFGIIFFSSDIISTPFSYYKTFTI